jgi:hypothetical protein
MRAYTKWCVLIRLITWIATATLAAAVLFRSSTDYRMAVCIIVSVATTTLAVRSLLIGKLVWALLFLGVLGIFTPFQRGQFSHVLISIFDLATLALFAVSPMLLRKSFMPRVSTPPPARL